MVANNGSAFIPPQTIPAQIFSKVPLGTIAINYEEIDLAQPYTAISGVSSKAVGNPFFSGGVGTKYDVDLSVGEYIFYGTGIPETTVLNQVVAILSPNDMAVDVLVIPQTGDVNYISVPIFRFDNQPPLTTQLNLLADPTAITASKTGNRFYYAEFYAWNWNTNAIENMAQTYAASIGATVQDIGWEDEASWVLTTNNILTYGGWNATITTVAPDPLLINNANQEIVLYYTTGTETLNGLATNVVSTISFIEQSNVAQDYKTQLGDEPFKNNGGSNTMMQISFDATEYFGMYVASPSQVNPSGVPAPNQAINAQFGSDNVQIGILTSSYDATSTFELQNQNLSEGQFQVFVKYTTYDGVESVVAKKLVEMGITVNPENVSWYVKEMQDRNGLDEIEWTFDDEEEAPVQDEPQNFDPLSDNPTDYVPRNAKNNEESEEDAD